jgi:predicted dehydrogenase
MSEEAHSLTSKAVPEVAPPAVDYEPPLPEDRAHPIALIGAGDISSAHLDAYRKAGFNVRVIASRTLANAVKRRDQFFPEAEATDDIARTLERPDIAAVDITLHPEHRAPLIEAALEAGKHVLSQKPFVLDLALGERLADLAEARGLMLAVNQQGRWAPHMSFMREAVRQGLIGNVQSVHIAMQWDHSWVAGTHHDSVEDLILYDFAIHWFDFLASLIGRAATSVYATRNFASGQKPKPALLAQALVEFPHGQAALLFDGATKHGPRDRTIVTGTEGTLESLGPDLGQQQVTYTNETGFARPKLEGTWFNDGFIGAMGALLQSIETRRPPIHNARNNLDSLALAFAAIASSRRGVPVAPGSIRSMAEATANPPAVG